MNDKRIPPALRWLLFTVGIGTSVAAGIYTHIVVCDGFKVWTATRALLFLVIGVLGVLMYGENR